MQIKNRKFNVSIFSLGFNETFSNFVFLVSILFIFINWLLGFMGMENLQVVTVMLWVMGFTVVAMGIGAGPVEGFEKNYDGDYRNPRIISDFKKGLVYLVIYILVSIIFISYTKHNIIPKKEIHIRTKITKVIFTDIHKKADTYGIRYFDKNNNNLFTDVYNKEADRNTVYNKIFNKDGSPRSEIVFINNNGDKSVEIYLLDKSLVKH